MAGKRSYQGFFKPKNPRKYRGDISNIVFRSSWELKFMNILDTNPDVLEWASEPIAIPYVKPLDNKVHRYFPDFWVRTAKETCLIEIKPDHETRPPKRPKKVNRRFVTEHVTYTTNQAKWDAAQSFCQRQGWKFRVATEYDLGIKQRG